MSPLGRALALPFFLFAVACAEPPSREMQQAQDAINAARAAGAEQYAGKELQGAAELLQRAHQAVTERDYRRALAHAIDSRDQAQAAIKAVDAARARARADAERAIADADALMSQARTRLAQPDIARLPRRTVTQIRAGVDDVQKSLQEARAALAANDHARAAAIAAGVTRRVQSALEAIGKAEKAAAPRKR